MRSAEEVYLFTNQETEALRGTGLCSSLLRPGTSGFKLCFPSKLGVRERGEEEGSAVPTSRCLCIILALLLISCVTLGKFLNLSLP